MARVKLMQKKANNIQYLSLRKVRFGVHNTETGDTQPYTDAVTARLSGKLLCLLICALHSQYLNKKNIISKLKTRICLLLTANGVISGGSGATKRQQHII